MTTIEHNKATRPSPYSTAIATIHFLLCQGLDIESFSASAYPDDEDYEGGAQGCEVMVGLRPNDITGVASVAAGWATPVTVVEYAGSMFAIMKTEWKSATCGALITVQSMVEPARVVGFVTGAVNGSPGHRWVTLDPARLLATVDNPA